MADKFHQMECKRRGRVMRLLSQLKAKKKRAIPMTFALLGTVQKYEEAFGVKKMSDER
jgi:hypothetical protein